MICPVIVCFSCTVSSEIRLCICVHKKVVRYWDSESKKQNDDEDDEELQQRRAAIFGTLTGKGDAVYGRPGDMAIRRRVRRQGFRYCTVTVLRTEVRLKEIQVQMDRKSYG
jgi:hypothetical protein